jgi:F-type H+-transporting ATPase subunit b
MLAMTEGAGGLFDFNATLPLMAIQFVLLTVVLTFIFYKPITKVLEDRESYINGNLTQASDKLLKADELYKQYEEQLKSAKLNAQTIVAQSEKEAKDAVSVEITQARTDASKLIEQTSKELEAQKTLALEKLDTQVDELSQLIKEKLLGKVVL